MERREFLGMAAKGAAGAALVGLAGCSQPEETAEVVEQAQETAQEVQEVIAQESGFPEITWEMATSWPLSLDTIFGGAQIFADRLSAITGGKFTILPRASGELVGGTEVMDAVETGALQVGHTASYYYTGKSPATAFGTALPFGLTARQQNAWLYEGGGLQLMQDFYAERFNLIQFPAGNTGAQMGGWYNKEINTPEDFVGLKMRIPGLGGQVYDRLGATVQVIPGGEIFQALQTGAIDATEWVGPYDDLKLGFHTVTRYYYYPGWWEPGPTLEVQINLDEYNALPEEYKAAIQSAAVEANMGMMARYDVQNIAALAQIREESEIELRPFSDEVLNAARDASFALYDEFSQQDTDFAAIFTPWNDFRQKISEWHGFNELTYLNYVGANA
ncbi:MAG: ABC transporter substrate-binding protein [Anaerolineaceae bacterium]|nr:ABC transporter substrate-binding protein [Anaerolineaceae bacterium]